MKAHQKDVHIKYEILYFISKWAGRHKKLQNKMNNFNKNWKSLGSKWQKLGNVKYLEIKSRLN